jgi:hypothetical protein
VTDRFQDGRRRHVGNLSECYKMGNKAEVQAQFQDSRRRHFGN